MKKLNKKAFTYVVTASVLGVLLIVVFLTTISTSYQEKQDVLSTRIRAMNDFILDFKQDVHRANFIAAFRALLALEDHIASTGDFVEDIDQSFKETFVNGTINGNNVTLMNGSSLSEYILRVNALANQVGINTNITVTNVILNQSNPWSVDVNVFADVNISDTRNIASWSFSEMYTTNVPIDNLRDPLYSTFTANKLPNTIRFLDVEFLVNTTDNDTTNLVEHANASYYIASEFAPTFIMRFENQTNASPNGIESLVNIDRLSDQELEVYSERSKVDFIYFNNLAVNGTICNVENVSADLYFIIPDDRDELYEVDGLNYSTSCP